MQSEREPVPFEVLRRAKVPFAALKRGVPKWRIVTRTFVYFMKNQLPSSAAALSYFVMLALFPIILLLFSFSNYSPKFRQINSYALETVIVSLPRGVQEPLVDYLLHRQAHPSQGEVIVCIAIILWAASWGFSIIEQAINHIWRTACRSWLHGRLVSVLMIMAVGALLIASALATAALAFFRSATDGISSATAGGLALSSAVWPVVFSVVGLMLTISLFALVYKVVPNTHVSLVEALPGAVIAGIAWEIAKYLFAWSLAEVPYEGLYGPLAAVVAALTWIYISNLIMLFGAQMTVLLHCEYLVEEQKPQPHPQSAPRVMRAAAQR
jgi:YihY family inner membrane protein